MFAVSVSRLNSAEQIKMLFGVNTFGGPGNIVLDGGPDPPTTRGGGFNAAFAGLLWPFVCDTQSRMPSLDSERCFRVCMTKLHVAHELAHVGLLR